jgi:hypothetical protein
MTLPTNSVSFQAENARSWLVRFWELPGKWVGIAFPFGFVLWILFYFDHNVSVCFSFKQEVQTSIGWKADGIVVDSSRI